MLRFLSIPLFSQLCFDTGQYHGVGIPVIAVAQPQTELTVCIQRMQRRQSLRTCLSKG